jgi:hypothetical protein
MGDLLRGLDLDLCANTVRAEPGDDRFERIGTALYGAGVGVENQANRLCIRWGAGVELGLAGISLSC